jgi:hypothetical protein
MVIIADKIIALVEAIPLKLYNSWDPDYDVCWETDSEISG